MVLLLLDTREEMTILCDLVEQEELFEQILLPHLAIPMRGEEGEPVEHARPEWWVAGEDSVANFLGAQGHLIVVDGSVVSGGSPDALRVYKKARAWFGGARAAGPSMSDRFPNGVMRLKLVPSGWAGRYSGELLPL